MTRSVEIPEAAVEAVADALAEAGFVDPDDGTVGYWRDGEEVPVWVRPTTLVRVALKAAAALPYLVPAGDGGLREALERIARGDVPLHTPAAHFARDALAAHPAAPAVPQPAREDCPLCLGLGGIAPHLKWSEQRGKPLWTAHEYPSDDPHPTQPCPSCAVPQPAREQIERMLAELAELWHVGPTTLDASRGIARQIVGGAE